ncbi:hypothetical protein N7G274_010313 [Stereocaulon virgatum]|uniref:Fcf2 pre-rRNA processing C-terminal domain-containing protein n=1 Tax=Stereocaulon virgatum TaxID=373712 RepID=A0ABR4A124_9LECA
MPPSQHDLAMQDDCEKDDLSDGQIKSLLQRADLRLRTTESTKKHNLEASRIPKLDPGGIAQPYIVSTNGVARADPKRLVGRQDRRLSNTVRRVDDPFKMMERIKKEKGASTGPDFFDMPRTKLTPELKTDLQLLKMRSILDPHRHYKNEYSKASVPEYSQVGMIIEGPTEYLSPRLLNRERKRTFVEEILADKTSTGRFKRKYNDIQASKTSGGKAFYKTLKGKRGGGDRER